MKRILTIAITATTLSMSNVLYCSAQTTKGSQTWLSPTFFSPEKFMTPELEFGPLTRWWWPGNDVEKDELKRELQLFADNHFAGVEIQPMSLVMPTKGKGRADRIMSYDTPLYYSNLATVMEEARRLGLIVDLTNGSGWPSGGAHMTEEDNNQTLEYGMIMVTPNNKKPVKLPRAEQGDRPKAKIVAVLAARTSGDEGPTLWLNQKSVIDLTSQVKDSMVVFNTPEKDWRIITFWQMADMEAPMLMAARNSGFAMNHFDSTKVVKNYEHWFGERTGLTKYMGAPLRCAFNDSYEFRADRHFTDDFVAVFKKNRGYDPIPHLPANIWYGYNNMYYRMANPDVKPSFAFSEQDWRLRYDYDLTLSDLLKAHMLEASKNYFEPKGMLHRTQAYGLNMDMMAMAGSASIPEMETMQFGLNSECGYKIISSGAHLYNRPIVTCESAVYINRAFLTTPEKLRMTIDKILTSGVNQIIYHGTPYSYFPDGYPKEGWFPFYNSALGVNFSSALSETNAFWKYMGDINTYIQRAQYVLRSGKPHADVLIYFPFLNYTHYVQNPKELLCRGYLPDVEPVLKKGTEQDLDTKEITEWVTNIMPLIDKLNAAGVEWDWINDESLQELRIGKGRTLDVRGNEYQALILYNAPFIQLASAQNLKAVAEKGGNIVIMGDAPMIQPSYKDYEQNDRLTAETVKAMMKFYNVRSISSIGKLSSWIQTLTMPVRTLYNAPTLRQTRRMMDDGSVAQFYWNESEEWQNVIFQTHKKYAYAYWMNPENGVIIEAEKDVKGRVQKYFGPLSSAFLFCTNKKIEETENAQEKINNFAYSKAIEIASVKNADIAIDTLLLSNNEITDWRDIEYLEFCGNEATYTFNIDIQKNKKAEYYIDLGKVCYSAEVSINGQEIGKRIFAPFLFDVTQHLRKGTNTITVKVTPSKYNEFVKRGLNRDRLFKMLKDSGLAAQGILGPVRLLLLNIKD